MTDTKRKIPDDVLTFAFVMCVFFVLVAFVFTSFEDMAEAERCQEYCESKGLYSESQHKCVCYKPEEEDHGM